MSARDRMEQARREGMSYAMHFLDSKLAEGVNAADTIEMYRTEVKKRGAYNIPSTVDKATIQEFCDRVKRCVLDSVLALTCLVLHDEFDFGKKRLARFVLRFNDKADCLEKGYTTWEDTLGILEDETGTRLTIRWNGEDPTAGAETR